MLNIKQSYLKNYCFNFIGLFTVPSYVPEDLIYELSLMSEAIFSERISTVFQKSSPFSKEYNNIVYRLHESGVILHIQKQVIK